MSVPTGPIGRWRIVEAAAWPCEHLDLCGPAFLRIDADGNGEMAFGALTAVLDVGFNPSGIEFDWNGSDEGDQVHGTGWAGLLDDGRLHGEITFDNGDETTFVVELSPFSAACQSGHSSRASLRWRTPYLPCCPSPCRQSCHQGAKAINPL